MTAPAPSPAEAAIIDRFGIFDEERIVEEVTRAIQARLAYHRVVVRDSEASEAAVAAIAAYRATQDGGAEEAVRRVAAEVETWTDAAIEWYGEHRYDDAGTTYACGFEDGWNHAEERIRAALAPQAGDGAR